MNIRHQTFLYKIAIFLPLATTLALPSFGADWGYDDETKEPDSSLKAKSATAGKLKPETNKSPGPKASPVAKSSPNRPPIIQSWLELLGLISQASAELSDKFSPDKLPTQLAGDQGARFQKVLEEHAKEPDVANIQNYWTELRPHLNDMDQRDNYRLLLRSLLRMKAAKMDDSNSLKEVIQEALGPDRIAISGKTSLSEDAIGAYTSMTCLLYEETHPGKTVNADDNREIFAQLVRNKFEQAPTDADKKAMNAFPLTWSIFRILYTNASESERSRLSKELAQGNKLSNLKITDKTLALVLSQFPK